GAAILATMVAVAAADGQVDDAEIDVIHGVVLRVTGQEIDRAAIARIATEPGADDLATASHMLAKLAPTLSSEGKEMVVKAAVFTAMADGTFAEGEFDRVMQVAVALGVSQTHMKGILADAGM